MPIGVGYGPEISNLGGIAGQRGLSTGEPVQQQPTETQQLRTEPTGESEPPLTEEIGQNVNFEA